MSRRVAIVGLSVAVIIACGREKVPAKDSSAAPNAAATNATPAGGGGKCPRTGHWGDCQLRARLEQSGLAPRSTTEKVGDLPVLPVPPVSLRVGNAGLAFFLFPDSLARHRAAATLDTVKYIPQTRPISMKAETTLIQNDNVLVLLFSKNEHQRERVADAIMAGPPQP